MIVNCALENLHCECDARDQIYGVVGSEDAILRLMEAALRDCGVSYRQNANMYTMVIASVSTSTARGGSASVGD